MAWSSSRSTSSTADRRRRLLPLWCKHHHRSRARPFVLTTIVTGRGAAALRPPAAAR
jgi:hypothetical protein